MAEPRASTKLTTAAPPRVVTRHEMRRHHKPVNRFAGCFNAPDPASVPPHPFKRPGHTRDRSEDTCA